MIKYFTCVLLVAISFSCSAQKLEKIKGNRDVVDVYKTLGPFNSLEISNDLKVSIKQGDKEGYHLETDANLVAVIVFEVANEKLHIYTKNNIQSSRRLNIDLDVTNLDRIILNDGSELKGLNKIESSALTLITLDTSSYNLDIGADELLVTMNGNSKGDLNVKRGDIDIILNDNSTLKGDMTLTECTLLVNERADFDMDGDVEDLKITAVGSANIRASKLRAGNVNVIASDDSEVYLNATIGLTVYAQGKSTLYIHGNPEITVEGFKDTSRLIKK